jgi:hypothetical protein
MDSRDLRIQQLEAELDLERAQRIDAQNKLRAILAPANTYPPYKLNDTCKEILNVAVAKQTKQKERDVVTDCPECAAYVKVFAAETGIDEKSVLKECSRHRSNYVRPNTPDGYWDVGFN